MKPKGLLCDICFKPVLPYQHSKTYKNPGVGSSVTAVMTSHRFIRLRGAEKYIITDSYARSYTGGKKIFTFRTKYHDFIICPKCLDTIREMRNASNPPYMDSKDLSNVEVADDGS